MSDEAIKDSRRILRAVRDHLIEAHLNLGARQESVGLVDVIYHENNRLPHLNYVSPRRNTAWIPSPQIELGLKQLRERERTARIYYIEGLYPPLFAKSLRELDLHIESEAGLMTYRIDPENKPAKPRPPAEFRVEYPDNQESIALWWYVWRNAHYDVITRGTEPLYIGRDMRAQALGRQTDIMLFRYGFPVAVARLTFYKQSAHLAALALMKEIRSPANITLLHQIAMHAAAEKGADIIFTSGVSESDRKLARKLGFVDNGSVVCYAEKKDPVREDDEKKHVAEPVFVLR